MLKGEGFKDHREKTRKTKKIGVSGSPLHTIQWTRHLMVEIISENNKY